MEIFQLIRGEVILGVVTLSPDDRIAGGAPWDVGWLQTAPGFEVVRHLFEREQRAFDDAMRLETEPGADGQTSESARLLEQATELQREIMTPGVRLVCLSDGRKLPVEELHVDGAKIVWR